MGDRHRRGAHQPCPTLVTARPEGLPERNIKKDEIHM